MAHTIKPLLNGPIVDIRGDTFWPDMSELIINALIKPFVDVTFQTFDLSLRNRDRTDDRVLTDAIAALEKNLTGVKGPTITPTADQVKEFGLKMRYGSPNGLIREGIGGVAITRSAIQIPGITRSPDNQCTLRMATGGIYGCPNGKFPGTQGTVTLEFKDAATGEITKLVTDKPVKAGGFSLTFSDAAAIEEYARFAFDYALRTKKKAVFFGNKVTIRPGYDGVYVDTFDRVFNEVPEGGRSYKQKFFDDKMVFFNGNKSLIDAVAFMIGKRSKKDVLIILKNYDGDVLTDVLAADCGGLPFMTSELESNRGHMMADPPHGTADFAIPNWKQDGTLLANPTSYIFAYLRAIEHRGHIENNPAAIHFAEIARQATVDTITQGLRDGYITGDLAEDGYYLNYEIITAQNFVGRIAENLLASLRVEPSFAPENKVVPSIA